jgi:hypothetical protein
MRMKTTIHHFHLVKPHLLLRSASIVTFPVSRRFPRRMINTTAITRNIAPGQVGRI